MDRLIDKTKQLIFARQTSIISSTLILSTMIVIARVFGFLRYRVLASFFTTEQLDIFLAAFRIPDLIFEILITGALTTTLIPFFIKYEKDKEAQSIHLSTIINIIITVLLLFVLVISVFLPHLMFILTPGYSKEKTEQIVFFSQLLLVGQLPLLVFGNVLTGLSQARKSFIIPAFAPIVYNVAIIAVTLLLGNQLSLLAPVIGVIAGAVLFFLVQLPVLFKSDFNYRLVIVKSKVIWDFFKMVIPRTFTVVIAQIEATVDLTLTTLLGSGAYTVFYLAQHLQLLPVSVIGIAFGQASLPYLTEMYQEKNIANFRKIVVNSVLNLLFLTVPIMTFFIFARTPIVRLFFGGHKFDWDATVLTAITLSYFSLSLPFHSAYYFLTRCFYAFFDSRTPFFISLVSIMTNAVLSIAFVYVYKMPVWSLALAFSISMILNVVILLILLYKKLNGFDLKSLTFESLKISFVTAIASLITYYLQKLLDGLVFDTTRTINVFFLLMTTGFFYFLLYLFLSWAANVKEMYLLSRMVLKVKEYQKKIFEVYTGVQ